MLLDELARYVVGQSTSFVIAPSTAGYPIWKGGFRADQPNTAVTILETGGILPTYTYAGVSFEQPTIQIISRSTSYELARTNAWLVYEILAIVGNANLVASTSTSTGADPTTRYVSITPNQSPFDMGNDAKARTQFSCNYMIQKVLST